MVPRVRRSPFDFTRLVDTPSERWLRCPPFRVPGSLCRQAESRASRSDSGSRNHEAHLSAEPDSPPPRPRLPLANEDPRWPARPQAPPSEGAEAAHSVDSVETRVIPPTGPFPREARIRQSREFREIAQVGRRHATGAFVLLVRPSRDGTRGRLGVTASRKVGNAVVRNRVKRWIREWFRRGGSAQLAGLDVVVIARDSAATLRSDTAFQELSRVAQRAR